MFDKVILDLISLLLAAAGIFSVLTRFYSPQLNQTYAGFNPHAVKRDVIDTATTWVFVLLALIGVIIQGIAVIKGDSLPRKHVEGWYAVAFVLGLVGVVLLTLALGRLGRLISRPFWRARIGKLFAENLDYLSFMIGTRNRYFEHYKTKHCLGSRESEESLRRMNLKSAQRMVGDLEKLLELKVRSTEWADRLKQILPFIEPHYDEYKTRKRNDEE